MAVLNIDNVEYKTTNELIPILGISGVTLYGWINSGKINAPDRFHRRGWRLWNKEEIEKLKQFSNGIHSKNGN